MNDLSAPPPPPYKPTIQANPWITIATILTLIGFYPVGLILLWVVTKWSTKVKILLTVAPFILGILAAILIIAIYPRHSYQNTSTSTSTLTAPSELAGVPVYPGASFVNKEDQTICFPGSTVDCTPVIVHTYEVKGVQKTTIIDWYNDPKSTQGWTVSGGGGCVAPAICEATFSKEGNPLLKLTVEDGTPQAGSSVVDIMYTQFKANKDPRACLTNQIAGDLSPQFLVGKTIELTGASGKTGTFMADGNLPITVGFSYEGSVAPTPKIIAGKWQISQSKLIISNVYTENITLEDFSFYSFNGDTYAIPHNSAAPAFIGPSRDKVAQFIQKKYSKESCSS